MLLFLIVHKMTQDDPDKTAIFVIFGYVDLN